MCADFGRNAIDATRGVKAGASAFVGTTAVADVATFAFFFVAIQKFTDFFASCFIKSGKDVPLHVTGV